MCLRPITITTRTKYINAATIGQDVLSTFNCGKCAECLQAKQYEYAIRSKAMYDETRELGGFTYWDTFTYSEQNVPVYHPSTGLSRGNDKKLDYFLCFNSEDYQKFFKRLRTNLSRDGYQMYRYDADGNKISNLRYLWVCEYGDITARPHYHALFFCTIPNITPKILDDHLSKAWTYGIRDIQHSVNQRVVVGDDAIYYVTKYVIKDQLYLDTINKYCLKYDVPEEHQKNIRPFHRQSQGYGLSLLNKQDYQRMYETGKMIIADKTGYHQVTIPDYLKRKLWYTHYTDSEGRVHWKLNEEGKKQMESNLFKQIDKMEQRYKTIYDNISSLADNRYKTEIDTYLNGRSFRDLAIYNRVYRGRLLPCLTQELPTVSEMLQARFEQSEFDYSLLKDLHSKGYDIKSLTGIDIHHIYEKIDDGFLSLDGRLITFEDFVNAYTLDQESFAEFKHFDYITATFRMITLKIDRNKHEEWKRNEIIKRRHRHRKNT